MVTTVDTGGRILACGLPWAMVTAVVVRIMPLSWRSVSHWAASWAAYFSGSAYQTRVSSFISGAEAFICLMTGAVRRIGMGLLSICQAASDTRPRVL